MYKTYTETLRGVIYRDRPSSVSCGSAGFDVGTGYTMFVTVDYDGPASDDNHVPQMVTDGFTDLATPHLLAEIFSSDADSGFMLFSPVIDRVCDFIREKHGQKFLRKLSIGCVVIENRTKKARFAAYGNPYILVFDKPGRKYEFIWPRFTGVTEMYGPLTLTDRCNLLLMNRGMLLLLYNEKKKRFYRLYEEMMLEDLDSAFNLKSLCDITYIAADLGTTV